MSAPAPRPDAARERERLLTLANVQRMRGQLAEARKSLEDALALSGDVSSSANAPAHEMLGDILAAEEKWEEAKAAYATAHALDPTRVASERKLAQAALHLADIAHERALADALLRGEMPAAGGAFGMQQGAKSSPGLALLLSLFMPGMGQMINGQFVKGMICLGVFFVSMAVICLSPGGKDLVDQIRHLAAGQAYKGAAPSPMLWMLLFVSGVIWLYSVLDAPMTAGKKSGGDAPKVDKSGWEV